MRLVKNLWRMIFQASRRLRIKPALIMYQRLTGYSKVLLAYHPVNIFINTKPKYQVRRTQAVKTFPKPVCASDIYYLLIQILD